MDYYSENNNDNRQYYNPGYIKRSGGKIAGSVILSFFIAIFLFILLGMSAFKHLMKADNIRKMASRLDFSKLSSDILFESTDDDESMSDYLYEKIGEMKDIKEIPRDTFDEFVEKDLSPYFKGLLEDTADAIVNGKGDISFTPQDIAGLLEDTHVEGMEDIKLSDADMSVIESAFENGNVKSTIEQINNGTLFEEFDIAGKVFSSLAFMITAVILALMIIGVVIVNRHYVKALLLHIGIPFLIVGLLSAVTTFSIASVSMSAIKGVDHNLAALVSIFKDSVVTTFTLFTAIVAGLGLVFTAAGCFAPRTKADSQIYN